MPHFDDERAAKAVTGEARLTARPISAAMTGAPSELRRPAGVLLDMDGTLINSEPLWFKAQGEEYGKLGIEWGPDLVWLVIGMTIVHGTQRVLDHFHLQADAVQIGHRIAARVLDMVKTDGVEWRPGAYQLLENLGKWQVPAALVTSSSDEYAGLVASWAPHPGFAALVTGDMVQHGKPDPEPYQLAAQLLAVDPGQCVAFEDSPAGVTSARAAGTHAVGVPLALEIPAQPGVTIIDSLAQADEHFFDAVMHQDV